MADDNLPPPQGLMQTTINLGLFRELTKDLPDATVLLVEREWDDEIGTMTSKLGHVVLAYTDEASRQDFDISYAKNMSLGGEPVVVLADMDTSPPKMLW